MVGIEDPLLEIIAGDVTMRPVMELVRKVAATDVNVLVRGESGTGKDLMARVIHRLSRRSQGPFVKIDCSALPFDLMETELFGYEKGAFTDAGAAKPGRFELANGGSLVLDEIAQLSLPAQAKLLTAIEEKRFSRLSGTAEVLMDARIMALSNVDLEAAVAAKHFRHDLFYRLNVVTIHLPPLRDRARDVARLARRLLNRLGRKNGKSARRFSADAMKILCEYDYPGNIRELRNILEHALVVAADPMITPNELPAYLRQATRMRTVDKPTLADLERRYIQEILEYTNWHKSRAARILGIHRKTLLEKRKQYGIQ